MSLPSSFEPVRLVSVVRKLVGSTQSNLIQCDDGRLYVAKLYPNPQSPNFLANEAIGSTLLSHLDIPTPSWRMVSISSSDISKFRALSFNVPGGERQPQPGIHFASEYLAGPDHTIVDLGSIFDHPVMNYRKFIDIYVFDIWANHHDRRQCVYKTSIQSGLGKIFFIDNSHLFGNHSWAEPAKWEHLKYNLWTKPLTHTYDSRVDHCVREFRRRIPEVLHHTLMNIPSEWHGSDINKLEAWLLHRLEKLREHVEGNLAFHGFST